MGFNKTILPSFEELQKRYEEDPEATFRWLRKTDVFIGGVTESLSLAMNIIKQHNEKRKQNN